MLGFSVVRGDPSEPVVDIPRDYNAAHDFIDRHLDEGRADKIAVIDDRGSYTYADLAARVNRAGNMLRDCGIDAEQRVLICLFDGVDFLALFWGAIKIGAIPVPVNTLLTPDDYAYLLSDSRARTLVCEQALLDQFEPSFDQQPHLSVALVTADPSSRAAPPSRAAPSAGVRVRSLQSLLDDASPQLDPAPTTADDAAFWLYSSGSTGRPKGVLHLHSHLINTAALYARAVLGIRPDDVVFSVAKLFFAYGLGNSTTFPLYVGATSVLMAERPTPESVMRRLHDHNPTILFGVPTFYNGLLADPDLDASRGSNRLRIAVSAGEALPEVVAKRWTERFGVELLDGIGTTEMLHIFVSNRAGDVRFGSTGRPVPGYAVRIVDEAGNDVAPGELGELLVSGPTAGAAYWNKREKSLQTFRGAWTHTGDQYFQDADGYYVNAGRADDMLKVGGIWVSPVEVESALMDHPAVAEAAVVAYEDDAKLVKPKAFVVLAPHVEPGDALSDELKTFVKGRLAPYKYPRIVEFAAELPKTATGKVQRFKLRD